MATRNLTYGCKGEDVKELQRNLNKLGFNCGNVDGDFGTMTYSAVIKFQTSCKIIVDGIVGPQTRAAMDGKLKAMAQTVVAKASVPYVPSVTVETGRWNGHKFAVSPTLIYSFKDLQIKGSSEMINKDDWDQGFVSRKGANPMEVSFTVVLNAHTGCDVRKEAMNFIAEANNGNRDYFYVGNQKLVSTLLMLTDATVDEVVTSRNGTWIRANVKLTMKQCNATDNIESTNSGSSSGGSASGYSGGSGGGYSGGGGGGGGSYGGSSSGSKKASVKTSSAVTAAKNATKAFTGFISAIGNIASSRKNVSSANSYINKTTSSVKSSTTAKKVTTTTITKSRMSGHQR